MQKQKHVQKTCAKVMCKIGWLLPVILFMTLVVSCTTSKEAITATKMEKSSGTNSERQKDNDDNFHYMEDGRVAKYPGGMKSLVSFLSKNIKYPAIAQKKGDQGRVLVQVIINKKGRVRSPKILKSVSPELDQEALRVVRLLSNWEPAFQRGHTVNIKFTVPVTFHL